MKQEQLHHFSIVLAALVVSIPLFNAGYTNWDEMRLLVENPLIGDLSAKGIKEHFTSFPNLHYKPLVLLSWSLERLIFGDSATIHHVSNIIIHAFTSILVYLVLVQLETKRTLVWIAALIFAVHPLHMESVGWIAERKDVLFGFFYMASIWAYLAYYKHQQNKWLLVSVVLFACSAMSKMMAMSLPFVLIIIDRLKGVEEQKAWLKWKLPWIALLIIPILFLGGARLLAENSLSPMSRAPESFDLVSRFILALSGIGAAFIKTIIPIGLSPLHPYPESLAFSHYLNAIVILGASILLFIKRKTWNREWLYFLFFLIAFFPASQLVLPISKAFYTADRFSYIPLLGVVMMLLLIIDRIQSSSQSRTYIMSGLVAIYAIVAFNKSRVWDDSESLWTSVLNVYPKSVLAHKNLSAHYIDQADTDKAIVSLEIALEHSPFDDGLLYNLGLAYQANNRMQEAIMMYQQALEVNPNLMEAWYNLGLANLESEDYQLAYLCFEKVAKSDQNNFEAWYNLAISAYELKQNGACEKALTAALRINSQFGDAYYMRAIVRFEQGNSAAALQDAKQALSLGTQLDPGFMEQLATANE